MSKLIKRLMTEQIRERYAGATGACVVELTGLDVQAQEKLRRKLRDRKGRLEVVKNSLARLAFADTPLAPIGDALQGPCALVTSSESLIEIAKLLVESAKEFKTLKLKHAVFEGDAHLLTVEELSKMKGRKELIGELAALISSPGRALAGCLQGAQGRLAGCIKTLADKGE